MQIQVEERIRQLSAIDNKGNDSKLKSQRGWRNVDVYIEQHVSGLLSIYWLETPKKDQMLNYLIALLNDTFHGSLLCRMNQGKISDGSETDNIDRVRHIAAYDPVVNGQKSKTNSYSSKKSAKYRPYVYYNDKGCLCPYISDLHRMVRLLLTLHVSVRKNIRKTSRTRHGHCSLQWSYSDCFTESNGKSKNKDLL